MNELWKDVAGFEGQYQVSNLGQVRSLKNKAGNPVLLMKTANDKQGYQLVKLCNREVIKMAKVHRLVAGAFIPNPDNKPVVNHKNGNKKDNRATELEWCTQGENMKHAYKLGLNKGRRTMAINS